MSFIWTLILQQPCQLDLGSYAGGRLIPTIRMHLFQSCLLQPVDSALLELSNPEYEFISCLLRKVRDPDMIYGKITLNMMYDKMLTALWLSVYKGIPNVSVSFYCSIVHSIKTLVIFDSMWCREITHFEQHSIEIYLFNQLRFRPNQAETRYYLTNA